LSSRQQNLPIAGLTESLFDQFDKLCFSGSAFEKFRLFKISHCPCTLQFASLLLGKLAKDNHRNCRSRGVSFHGLEHFKAADLGQTRIQQHQVGSRFPRQVNCLVAVGRQQYQVSGCDKNFLVGQFLDFAVFN